MSTAFAVTVETPDGPFTIITADAAGPADATGRLTEPTMPTADAAGPVRATGRLTEPTMPAAPATPDATTSVVLASGWTSDPAELVGLIHPSIRPTTIHPVHPEHPGVLDATRAVAAFYAGDVAAPGKIPVRQVSGLFRQHAWDVLRAVEAGQPITYTQYAERAGRPTAVRAAAGACAMNAAALFVPCHRVLRTDGSLGGFRWGLDIKRSLLDRERR